MFTDREQAIVAGTGTQPTAEIRVIRIISG
jgi:hypothetical protein